MTGLRQLAGAPGPAIAFVLLFALVFAGGFGVERAPLFVALGLGGVIGGGMVLSAAALFGARTGIALLLGAGFLLVALLSNALIDLLGWSGLFARAGALLGVVAVLAIGLQAKLALPLRLRATGVVAVPRAYAFAAAIPRPTTRYWKPHARRIEADPVAPDRVRQVFTSPHMPEGAHLTIALEDVVEPERFTMRVVPGGDGDLGGGQEEVETWRFADHLVGAEITVEVELQRGEVLTYLVALVLRPHADQLQQFRAAVEGGDDLSFAAGFRT